MTPAQRAARSAYDAAAAEFGAARAECLAIGYDPADEDERVDLDRTERGSLALDRYTIAVDETEKSRIADAVARTSQKETT